MIYQLRIQLQDLEPQVWRSLRVPGTVTLAKLHKIFQDVMGWTDRHLHKFEIGQTRYGVPDPDSDSHAIVSEKRVTLDEALTPSITHFLYYYDFGDGWEHEVLIEGRAESVEPDEPKLLCTAGAGACPPEDVGGPAGYQEFLNAIKNPRHKQHRSYLKWCGGAFDPAGFDLQGVNRKLRGIRIRTERRIRHHDSNAPPLHRSSSAELPTTDALATRLLDAAPV